MKKLWNWIGSRNSYKIASVVCCLYISMSELGRTESWLEAGNIAILFFCAWYLGRGSSIAPQGSKP